ncbi:MAG: iron-containing redox enzyme family protein [Byssovorax sp.]
MEATLKKQLTDHPLRAKLFNNEFFTMAKTAQLTKADTADFLGQYWHPIHYFAPFLAKVIAVAPFVGIQTAVSKILWQELGEGNPEMAHEFIYIDTMTKAGFTEQEVCKTAPNAATEALMRGYREATADYCGGLGFMYGTEIIDLTIVQGLGETVRRTSGMIHLPWVDIHVVQEPDHVDCANVSIQRPFTDAERKAIVDSAALHWELWDGFFSQLCKNAMSRIQARAAA